MSLCLSLCLLCLMTSIGYSQFEGRLGPKGEKGDIGDVGLQSNLRGQPGQPGQPGQLGYPGLVGASGPRGHYGPPGIRGTAATCEIDISGSIIQKLETFKKSIAKLELAINYDHVKRVLEKYFVSYKERGSFSEAVEFCSQRGLELALPQNTEENFLLGHFFGGDDNILTWINVNNKKAEGNFEADMKNQPLIFTNWGEGQPDRSIQDSGCTMLTENGFWRVVQECSLPAYIICQL